MLSIFVARLFLSAIFLMAGVDKVFSWSETERELMNALCEWHARTGMSNLAQDCLTALIPWAPFLLVIAVLLELSGGLMVLLGFRERLGAILLLLVIIPATLLFHSFWFLDPGSVREMQAQIFFRNLAILSGLIFVTIHGAQVRESDSPSGFS